MTLRGLLRTSVELLWQHPRLLLPVLIVDVAKFVLAVVEKHAAQVVENALLPGPVLGVAQVTARVILAVGTMHWATYFIFIMGYVVALGILADWVPCVQQGQPFEPCLKWPDGLWRISGVLLGCVVLFLAMAFLTASHARNEYAFYAAFGVSAALGSLIFGWFLYPFVLANGTANPPSASRRQTAVLVLLGVVLSLAIEFEVVHEAACDFGLNALLHTGARWGILVLSSLVAALPYAVIFVAITLRNADVEVPSLTGENECFE